MKYTLTGKNIKLTEADEDMLAKKLGRLKHLLSPPFHAEVLFRHDRHHRHGDVITCAVLIKQAGKNAWAERKEGTVQDALDETLAAIKSELLKIKDKAKRQ